MYFTWLSGDMLVEQSVHSVDKMSWTFKDVPPVKCVALGSRMQRVEPEYGHIYDNFSVMYEWADGKRGFVFARQQAGCSNENNDYITGAKGHATVMGFRPLHAIQGADGKAWSYEKEGGEGGVGPGGRRRVGDRARRICPADARALEKVRRKIAEGRRPAREGAGA